MEKPKRFYTENRKAYFTFDHRYSTWINQYIDEKPWHCLAHREIGFGLDDTFRFLDWDSFYYDGHIVNSFHILGLVFIYIYTYQSEELK